MAGAAPAGVLGELRLDGLVHALVDGAGSERLDDPVGAEDRGDPLPDPGQAELDAVRVRELVELGQLRSALRVDEVDALEEGVCSRCRPSTGSCSEVAT